MFDYKICKSKTEDVRKILRNILSYLEYIYSCNHDKIKDVEKLKSLVESTMLRGAYLDMQVKVSKKVYSYVSFNKKKIFLTKEDLTSDNFEYIVTNICITEFLKKALEYVKGDNIKSKYISFYRCLLNLNVIPTSYKEILNETDIISSYITDCVINY